jgi:hypothetical protein
MITRESTGDNTKPPEGGLMLAISQEKLEGRGENLNTACVSIFNCTVENVCGSNG